MSYHQNWRGLFRVSGAAALLAGLFFRRNIGAEISLFTGFQAVPSSAAHWFTLLQQNPLLGLSFLGFFDLINSLLLGLIFLGLTVALWSGQKGILLIAVSSGFLGVAVAISSNISLCMLALSRQEMMITCERGREAFLGVGEALLVMPLSGFPGTGAYMGLFLIALAGLLFSLGMLSGRVFKRSTAIPGMIASSCDLFYCLTFAFLPFLQMYLIATAGLFWMIWHLMTGWQLLQLAGKRKPWFPGNGCRRPKGLSFSGKIL